MILQKIAGNAVWVSAYRDGERHENDNVAIFDDPLETAQFFVCIEPEKERE